MECVTCQAAGIRGLDLDLTVCGVCKDAWQRILVRRLQKLLSLLERIVALQAAIEEVKVKQGENICAETGKWKEEMRGGNRG